MNKSKTRISCSPNVSEDLDKPKRKSKLSLNTSTEKSKHKVRDGNGQSSIISFFQAKVVPNTDFDSNDSDITIKKNGKHTSIICSESDSDVEITENDVKKETKNAFTFMMDRSKGQNSPGREFEEVDENIRKNERKKRLSDRKELFQDSAEQNGAPKKLKKTLKSHNKPEFVNKEKSKKVTHKHRKQKENDEFMLNCQVKWRMKVKINLSEEDTARLTVPKSIKPMKKLDAEEKGELGKGKVENGKSKASGEKVAPIFNIGVPKNRPDGGTIKARIDFLRSDPPEHVKKCIDKHQRHFTQSNDLKACESLQMWTDLYKPETTKLVFGNHSAVSEVKTWLETWVDCTKAIGTRRNSSSSSDFESDGEDSRDKYNAALPRNGLMLYGPHGCGKTMTVYAVCNELGINVLEVNASNKRTGKKLLMELQEATLSHQVNKIENSLQQHLQKSRMDKMCLLLIEDVDLVFEQDDGFISALCQLLTTSKRPIILTTTDKNCLYLEKFSCDLITFTKLSTKLASPWLQLVCLVEGLLVNQQSIDTLLENNNYDMRTTLLQIQFWVQSGGQFFAIDEHAAAKINRDVVVDEVLFQDDNSNVSCLSEEDLPECNISQSLYVESFRKSPMLDLDMTWWNLDMPPPSSETAIKDALNVFETLSAIDIVYKKFHIFGTERQNPTDSLELSESEEGGTIKRSKCNNSLAELIPLVCHLQYDSINLDYFSTLRTMNRSEIVRGSNNNKRRRSRFYNYLRGLGLNNEDVDFTILSSIFNVENT
ncbi:hypothetical protein FQR65_LT05940 [Abscondita terminalis]|nr:hypothetical protein FQR65_LT05940 [Abscondita terminalis]